VKYSVEVVIKAIDQATKVIQHIGKQFSTLNKSSAVGAINANFQALQGSISNVGREAGLLTTRFIGLSAAGIGLFAAFIGPAAKMEEFRGTLTNLYGDAGKAATAMDTLSKFAMKSPYSFEQILDSMTLMKQVGLEPLDGTLQGTMNYFAMMGINQERARNATLALTQAWAKQKIQGDDIRQLTNAQVPIWSLLSEATGKSVKVLQRMASAGELNLGVMKLLFDLMARKGAKGAAAMAYRWSTLVSNLGDIWMRFTDIVMNSKIDGKISVFDTIKNDVAAIGAWLQDSMKPENAQNVANALNSIYQAFRQIATQVLPVVVSLAIALDKLAKNVGGYGNLLMGVIAIMSGPLVQSIVSAVFVSGALLESFLALTAGGTALELLAGAIALLGGPITIVTGLVLGLGAAGLYIVSNWEQVNAWFTTFWDEYGNLIMTVFPLIRVLAAMGQFLIENWEPVKAFFQGLWDMVMFGANQAKAAIDALAAAANSFDPSRGNRLFLNPGAGIDQNLKSASIFNALLTRASGGPFGAGDTMLVGEEGPEIVQFGRGGFVYPNNILGAGGGSTNVSITLKLMQDGKLRVAEMNQTGNKRASVNLDMGYMTA
jgi:tape measure domain-containing protein